MKTCLALTAALITVTLFTHPLVAGPESLASKEIAPEPAVSQPCNWTGFYIGVQGGYGWGDLKWTEEDKTFITEHDHDGFFVGGEEGYNYQIGWLVIGAEGDFSYSDVNGRSSRDGFEGPGTTTFETGTDWVGNAGLRVGVAFKRFLFFVKGGVSFAHLEYDTFRVDTDTEEEPHNERFQSDEMRTAPLVGGGVEYALSCHWSAKVEYKHLFLGRNHIHGTSVDIFPGETPEVAELDTFKTKTQQNQVQFGLNYKF
jgi:outer membrane immunogenic protein